MSPAPAYRARAEVPPDVEAAARSWWESICPQRPWSSVDMSTKARYRLYAERSLRAAEEARRAWR